VALTCHPFLLKTCNCKDILVPLRRTINFNIMTVEKDLKVLIAMTRRDLIIYNSPDLFKFEAMYGEEDEYEDSSDLYNACMDYEDKHSVTLLQAETTPCEDLMVLIKELEGFQQHELCGILHGLRDDMADSVALGYGWIDEKFAD
jgi:hypothetical protein